MRVVSLTPRQFNFFLWPAYANASAKAGDPEVLVRLARKIKQVSIEADLSPAQEEAVEAGTPVFPDRRTEVPVKLRLQEDEHRTLRGIYNSNMQNFAMLAIEEAYEVQQAIDNAPTDDDQEFTVGSTD